MILSAFAGLLVVPVAVNIGTGGDVPQWLKPLATWLWPIALICVLLVIALELWDSRPGGDRMSVRRPTDPRNVELALTRVARYVEARQRGSLGEQMRIALALDDRPEAVRQPAHLVRRIGGQEFELSADLTIDGVFAEMHESMLILGAPGAGKTTQLLDLAQALVTQARAATDPRIPVVLDLADWIAESRPAVPGVRGGRTAPKAFDDWLVARLASRYEIPEAVSRWWLAEDRLTLLLDGLDEVPEAERERCVAEINTLQSRHGVTRVAVCSRETDYERLTGRLQLQGAVIIRPLDRERIQRYVASVSPAIADVVTTLEADEELWELLTTPLMLAIMAVASVDRFSDALAGTADPVSRRRQLFDAYVVEVLARRRSHEHSDPETTLRAIHTLALAATELNTGVSTPGIDQADIEKYVPEAVRGVASRWIGQTMCLVAALAVTTTVALRFGGAAAVLTTVIGLGALTVNVVTEPARITRRWAFVGVLLAAAAVPVGLTVATSALADGPWHLTSAAMSVWSVLLVTVSATWVVTFRTFNLRREAASRNAAAVVAVGLAALGIVALLGLRPYLVEAWLVTVAPSLWMVVGLVLASMMTDAQTERASSSRLTSVVQCFLYLAASVVLMILLPSRWPGPFWEVSGGIVAGLLYAFLIGFPLAASLSIVALRVAMYIAGEPNPWRRSFLKFAADRSLLTHTEGEYRFIHLLIRDHLAACDPPLLARAVHQRRAELQPTAR